MRFALARQPLARYPDGTGGVESIQIWPILKPMLLFAGFIILALLVRKGERPAGSARLKIFIAYVIAVSMYVGWTGRDMWPFAAWHYVAYAIPEEGNFVALVGVDAGGHEYPLDSRTFEPLEFTAVLGNIDWKFQGMSQAHQSELLRFLLKLAQDGLARAHAGQPVGRFARLLGPFAARPFQFSAKPWSDPSLRPNEINELRLYRIRWRIFGGETARVERRDLLASTKS